MNKIKLFFKIVFALAFLVLLADGLALHYFSKNNRTPERADATIVLGAAINSQAAKNRALEGLQLWQSDKSKKLVLTGGKIKESDISEAEFMRKVILKENPEAKDDIILEAKSGTTFDNLKNSRELIPNANSVIIVSDPYHLARGVLTAKGVGFKNIYWQASDPSASGENLRYHYIREFFAILSYIPHFLGK